MNKMSIRPKSKQQPKLTSIKIPNIDTAMAWIHNYPEERGMGFRQEKHDGPLCYCETPEGQEEQRKIKEDWYQQNQDKFPPLPGPEVIQEVQQLYEHHPELKTTNTDEDEWIQTYTGKRFHPLNAKVEDICIEDIAHALSQICRFTGHSQSFYSVAQHSVLVSYVCDKNNALYGLLHDMSEAFLGDISRPLKRTNVFRPYREYEKKLQEVMCAKFGLPLEEPKDVKWADNKLLVTEARDLMSPLHPDWQNSMTPLPFKIDPLPPKEAKQLFLDRFQELFPKANI